MSYLDELTEANIRKQFNILALLENCVFYPASGIDYIDIECLIQSNYNSFVHVDYSIPRNVVIHAMTNHFASVGYRLMGGMVIPINQNQLTPNGFTPHFEPLNAHERSRLEMDFIRNAFNGVGFNSFALWGVYELSPISKNLEGKIKRFSLLHVGGEACATYDALFLNKGINPSAVAIISPGEGYGDNWTLLRDPNFRLHQMILTNVNENGATMPKNILTNMTSVDEQCFWPGYIFDDTCFAMPQLIKYRYEI